MDIILIITGILFILGSLFFAILSNSPFKGVTSLVCFFGLLLYGGGISLSVEHKIDKTRIPAIEVYRGNTTLQITYQDSIAIDSIVVYKNNSL